MHYKCIIILRHRTFSFWRQYGPSFRGLDWIRCAWLPLKETNACHLKLVFFFIFTWLSFILAENLLGYIDWIPQRLEVQFSASHGGSLPGTTGYIREGACALSVSNTTTKRQTGNRLSEGTIFRKGFYSICQRFNFLSFIINKLIERNISFFLCFCLGLHIHSATICVVRSYCRPSYLLHGFRVVRRLAFYVRDQWSLFSSEVHAKLTRLVNGFVRTNMFCFVVFLCTYCTLQFEDSKVHGGCDPVLMFLVLKNMPFWLQDLTSFLDNTTGISWRHRMAAKISSIALFSWWHRSLQWDIARDQVIFFGAQF